MLISTATDVAGAELLAVIADPTRFHILSLLAAEELCSIHLQEQLAIRQTLVSHHLKVLREAGLVETSPCGRFTYYRLRAGAFDSLSSLLGDLADASRRQPRRRAC